MPPTSNHAGSRFRERPSLFALVQTAPRFFFPGSAGIPAGETGPGSKNCALVFWEGGIAEPGATNKRTRRSCLPTFPKVGRDVPIAPPPTPEVACGLPSRRFPRTVLLKGTSEKSLYSTRLKSQNSSDIAESAECVSFTTYFLRSGLSCLRRTTFCG